MSIQQRIWDLSEEVKALHSRYIELDMGDRSVTMFEEDFSFLKKQGKMVEYPDGRNMLWDANIFVVCGPRKKPQRKRRPPQVLV